jgi:hypothetical protein
MKGFSFVTPVTHLRRPNTEKEDLDDDNDDDAHSISLVAKIEQIWTVKQNMNTTVHVTLFYRELPRKMYIKCLLCNYIHNSLSFKNQQLLSVNNIYCLSQSKMLHYLVHETPPLVTVLSKIHSIHILMLYLQPILSRNHSNHQLLRDNANSLFRKCIVVGLYGYVTCRSVYSACYICHR